LLAAGRWPLAAGRHRIVSMPRPQPRRWQRYEAEHPVRCNLILSAIYSPFVVVFAIWTNAVPALIYWVLLCAAITIGSAYKWRAGGKRRSRYEARFGPIERRAAHGSRDHHSTAHGLELDNVPPPSTT
jgi:hypothetical protein